MKKIIAVLMMLLVVVPFISAKAIEGNYYVYGKGDEVNFYTYEGDTVGSRTIILSDEGANSQYVKTLVTGFMMTTPYAELPEQSADITQFKNTLAYSNLKSELEGRLNGMPYARNLDEELSLITLDELIDVFGATQNGDTYTIDATKWGNVFRNIESSKEGMFTQTLADNNTKVWVVKFPKTDAGEVTSITVEKEDITSTWTAVPVVYLDKTYDCVERENQENYACYTCEENDYTWVEVGQQGPSCTLVENVSSKAACVKSPQTGVEEYFVEFAIVVGICAVALVVIKRIDLFRSI